MKTFAIVLFVTYLNIQYFPEGVWIQKQDSSRIEIIKRDGKLSGILISTKNPNSTVGTLLLKDFHFNEGYWQGKFYLLSKDRWVDAKLSQRKTLLIVELDFGYKTKKEVWYKDKR